MRTRTVLAAALTPGMRLSANRVITSATLTDDGRVHVVTAPGTAYTDEARPLLTVTDYDIDQDVTVIERVPTAATWPFINVLRARASDGWTVYGRIAARSGSVWQVYDDDGSRGAVLRSENIIEWEPLVLLSPPFARRIAAAVGGELGEQLTRCIDAAEQEDDQ